MKQTKLSVVEERFHAYSKDERVVIKVLRSRIEGFPPIKCVSLTEAMDTYDWSIVCEHIKEELYRG